MRNVNTRKNAGQLDQCSVTQLNTQHSTFLLKVNIVLKENKKLNEKEEEEKQVNLKKGTRKKGWKGHIIIKNKIMQNLEKIEKKTRFERG